MSTNGKSSGAAAYDPEFLISDSPQGPHVLVERVMTVQSMPLPETKIAQVEMIRITEKKILVAPAGAKAPVQIVNKRK
jgi:hypothetical protein